MRRNVAQGQSHASSQARLQCQYRNRETYLHMSKVHNICFLSVSSALHLLYIAVLLLSLSSLVFFVCLLCFCLSQLSLTPLLLLVHLFYLQYWKYKFRNASENNSVPYDGDELTPLQRSFTCDLTLTATISGTTFLLLNAVYGHHISLRVKMLGTLSTILVLFGVTTSFVEVNTDKWQEQFFLITLIIVVLLNSE